MGVTAARFLLILVLVTTPAAAQWNADIDYLATQLPKVHPNPFRYVTRDEFNARIAALKEQTPGLSDTEIAIRLQQIVALIGDGHTELSLSIAPETYFPLRFYRFEDGIFVTKTTLESRRACGTRLVAIDGVSAEEVYARITTIISHENDAWVKSRAPIAMSRAEALRALGVVASTDTATFTFESSRGFTFDLVLHPISRADALKSILAADVTTPSVPLYRRHGELNYWYDWNPATGLLYIKYNRCSDDPASPFANLQRDVLAIADTENVRWLVIDVRNNPGGSAEVARGLINGIKSRTQLRGKVYTIIGPETFSSALFNAIDLHNNGATLAGEPTGGKPNAYGEVRSFALPSSRLLVFHSTRFFTTVPGDPPSLAPDIEATLVSTDFLLNRDPVLEAITGPNVQQRNHASGASGRRRAVSLSRSCPD